MVRVRKSRGGYALASSGAALLISNALEYRRIAVTYMGMRLLIKDLLCRCVCGSESLNLFCPEFVVGHLGEYELYKKTSKLRGMEE